MDDAADRRRTAIFLLAISVYFAVQAGLRLALGGAYETDEAEMLVMTPGLRLGYGPQLPLYNWLQLGFFELFGRGLPALALLKNLLLWATYLAVFLGLRLWLPAATAALGALSLFLIPDLAWEAQRATTHSNMLLATSAATLAAFLWAMRRGSFLSWAVLGLAIGLGGLAKYNYFLVPVALGLAALTLAPMRGALLRRRALIAPGLAGLILAAPYAWMLQNRDLAFSSLGKLHIDAGAAPGRLVPEGLSQLPGGLLALMALPLLVALIAWGLSLGRRRAETGAGPLPALLLRAALFAVVLTAAGIWAAHAGTITSRWLLPIAFLAVPGLFTALAPRLAARGRTTVFALMAVLALLVMAGLGYDRFKDGARRDVVFDSLPARLAEIDGAEGVPVIAEFYTAGNLAALAPGLQIAPYLPFAAHRFGAGPVLFLFREHVPPSLEIGAVQAGWPAGSGAGSGIERLQEGAFSLPYRGSSAEMPFRYVLARMPALP
ncbi:glycosyltransferase family 39 protein [Rhodovulum sp. YEN HP10]|uniref:glycosyltransferase family 39 protein n=1 Tax=Rhodovulum sp. HP10 TaxID=3387397 RepID=UPI0039DFB179